MSEQQHPLPEDLQNDSDLEDLDFTRGEQFELSSEEHSQAPPEENQVTALDFQTYKNMFASLEGSRSNENSPFRSRPGGSLNSPKELGGEETGIAEYEEHLTGSMPAEEEISISQGEKERLNNKIKEMLVRRRQKLQSASCKSVGASFSQSELEKASSKKTRVKITFQILEKLKLYFKQYDCDLERPVQCRVKFRDIAEKVGIATSTVTALYDEYTKDPLFSNRTSKIQIGLTLPPGFQFMQNIDLTQKRIQFIKNLLLENGPLTQGTITEEINKREDLLTRDKEGTLRPLKRRQIFKYMKIAGIPFKTQNATAQRNMNDPECIHNRFQYARKYLELTQDTYSDICFLGEFSCASMMSLSSCPPVKRGEFIEGKSSPYHGNSLKEAKTLASDKENSKIQYLAVISLEGIVYYEIFNNIFRDMNFQETLGNIGRAMNSRHRDQKKYLLLETNFLHRKNDLQVFEKKNLIKVIFLPPLTPMLNPTEYFFNEIKSMIKSKSYKTGASFRQLLLELLKAFQNKSNQNYFTCIGPYLELALKQQPFK